MGSRVLIQTEHTCALIFSNQSIGLYSFLNLSFVRNSCCCCLRRTKINRERPFGPYYKWVVRFQISRIWGCIVLFFSRERKRSRVVSLTSRFNLILGKQRRAQSKNTNVDTAADQCDQMLRWKSCPNVSTSCLKISTAVFTIIDPFKIAQKSTIFLGYFCKHICCQEL